MHKPLIARLALVTALAFVVVACGGNAAPASDPAKAVEAYLQARAKPDVNQMIGLSCAAWEPQARLEATSIEGRQPKLEGLACQQAGAEGSTAFVACQGRIITSYDGEQREFDLAERQFKLVQEGGEWRMCGYRN
jgi:hypothetical protein